MCFPNYNIYAVFDVAGFRPGSRGPFLSGKGPKIIDAQFGYIGWDGRKMRRADQLAALRQGRQLIRASDPGAEQQASDMGEGCGPLMKLWAFLRRAAWSSLSTVCFSFIPAHLGCCWFEETSLAKDHGKNYHVSMDTVEEIKRAIQTLTDEQRRELEAWWHPAYDDWDLQMDSDAKAGKFDALSEQALKDFRTGNCDEFP